MNLVYYHPIALRNTSVFHKCVNPLISVLDRTTIKWPNFEYINLFPMPSIQSTTPDFIETSVLRIKELTDHKNHVNVLWSGGIDSTFVMTLMIELGIADKLFKEGRLTIGLNMDSIRENPVFYEKFIKQRYLSCVVQADTLITNPQPNQVTITGEMADNLVGSLTMKSCVDYHNDFTVVHQKKQVAINWMARKLEPHEKNEFFEFIEQVCDNSPVEIVSSHDLLWYLNFNFKWQAVNFRIVSHAANQEVGNQLISNLHHFFNTDTFQQWSLKEGHYFEGSSWGDYKMVMKKQIYEVTNDGDYFKNKTKHPSLPSLLRYKDTFDFIYESNSKYTFTKQPIGTIL